MKMTIALSILAVGVSADGIAYPAAARHALEAQVTGTPAMTADPAAVDASCVEPVVSLGKARPTMAPALQSWAMVHPQTASECDWSMPNSLTADQSSYNAELYNWYTSHSGEITSIRDQCKTLYPDLASEIDDVLKCATVLQSEVTNTATKGNGDVMTITGTATAVAATGTTSQGATVKPVVEVGTLVCAAFFAAYMFTWYFA